MKEIVQIPEFRSIRFYETRVRLKIADTLDENSCIELLASVKARSSSKLEPIGGGSAQASTILGNSPELEYDQRTRFTISDSNTLSLGFGSKVVPAEMEAYTKNVFDAAIKVKRLQVSMLELADIIHVFDTKFVGNQHALVASVFYKGSVLESVFPLDTFTYTGVSIGGAVLDSHERQCVVYVNANTSVGEILFRKYDPDNLLDIIVGYAQIRKIPWENVGQFMVNLLSDARQYVVSNILDKVLRPLDNAIVEDEGIRK
jgi:hypothetical protein